MARTSSPEPLSRQQIVGASLQLVRDEGLEALTMRRLSTALGVSAMAVYWHVPNKEALLQLVADEALGEAVVPARGDRPWDAQLTLIAQATWSVFRTYPGLAQYVLAGGEMFPGPHALRLGQDCVALFLEAGFDEPGAARAFATSAMFVAGHVFARPASPATGAIDPEETFAYGLARLIDGFKVEIGAGQRGRRRRVTRQVSGAP